MAVVESRRKYQEIWEKLKLSPHKCSVQVHNAIVPRVVKAVIKEKLNDLAFKLANSHDNIRLVKRITKLVDKKHSRIDFQLKPTLGLFGIKSDKDIDL